MFKNSRFVTILHLCSFLVFLYSFSMLCPLFIGWLFNEPDMYAFVWTFCIAVSVGAIGWKLTRNGEKTLKTRDGFLVAVLFWFVFSAISTMPLLIDTRLNLSVTDAVFEGVSGITTTGASVLDDVDNTPKSILYYRAQLNFLGGLGIIILAVAVVPFLGIGGAKLCQAEMPGPMKENKFTPRLADTARSLWFVYASLAGLCGLSYYFAGMGWFDALCHSLSTVSLGGFSTRTASIGFYESPLIEGIAAVFSILAAVNFSLYFMAITRISLKPIWDNSEFRFFCFILSILVGITCLELYRNNIFEAPYALIHGFFIATSVLTDNGLGGADFPSWPSHIVLLILGASFFGGCVGSTCGGIKSIRFLLLYRECVRELLQLIHPNAHTRIKVRNQPVQDDVIRSVSVFFFLYIFFSCVFIWGLIACGYDFMTAFGTVAACINNMGIGYGQTSSGFGILNDEAKWLMCLAMLLG